jgi:hypothetical protein
MDLAAINDDPDLHHTPFGRVLVSRAHGGGVPMCSIEHAASGMPMVVGLLRDGAGVFDGLHGKRQWEAWHVLDKAERFRIREEMQRELSLEDHRADFRREINKSLARVTDGRELLAAAMALPKHRGRR